MSWKDVESRIKILTKSVAYFEHNYSFKRWPEVLLAYNLEYRKAWLKSHYIKEKGKQCQNYLTEHDVNVILDDINLELQPEIKKLQKMEYSLKSLPNHVMAPILEHANLSGQRDYVFRGLDKLQ